MLNRLINYLKQKDSKEFILSLKILIPITSIIYYGLINKNFLNNIIFNSSNSVQLNNLISINLDNPNNNQDTVENVDIYLNRGRSRIRILQRRYIHAIRSIRNRNRDREIERNFFSIRNKNVTDQKEAKLNKCSICYDNIAKVTFSNCGHVACCNSCSLKVNSKCPICRKKGIRIPLFF